MDSCLADKRHCFARSPIIALVLQWKDFRWVAGGIVRARIYWVLEVEPRPFPSYSPLAASLVCLPVRALRKNFLDSFVYDCIQACNGGSWGGGILKKYLHVKRFPRLSLESKLVPGQYREYCGKTGHHFRRSKVRSFLSGVTDSDSGIYRKVPKPFRKS